MSIRAYRPEWVQLVPQPLDAEEGEKLETEGLRIF
jgi:hypothetical protein